MKIDIDIVAGRVFVAMAYILVAAAWSAAAFGIGYSIGYLSGKAIFWLFT